MKTYYFLAAVATMAFVACSDSEYLGEEIQPVNNNQKEICFVSGTKGLSRANHVGADAAALLNNQFIVEGTKGSSSVGTNVVYDNYKVQWVANSANLSQSNGYDWEYAGLTAYELSDITSDQEIKYWDYSAAQYDFITYSFGDATPQFSGSDDDSKVKLTKIDPATATNNSVGAYTMRGVTDELAKVYIADLVTVPQSNYGSGVNLSFRKLAAKIRLAIYETIPGYSVRDVEFYTDGGTPATNAVSNNFSLYSAASDFISKGTFMIYFPTTNTPANSDNNKAHVALDPTGATTSTYGSWGALDYQNTKTLENGNAANYLGETSATATYAGNTASKQYFNVLPNETASAYTLRVNYTLVANDASGETIKVWGANAVIPAAYTQWKSNYAYTYIFKISDKTNGSTEQLGGTEGLQAITFDAVVIDSEEYTGESVNNVCTPSITTYQQGDHVYNVDNDEYAAGDIYVMVQDGATMKGDLATKGQLYVIDASAASTAVSEATVMDALNMGTTTTGVTTGRNGIKLTTETSDATVTAIPGEDGNTITVTAGQAAKFSAAAGKVYAYAYQVSTGTPTTYYTAVYVAAGQQANGKYTKNADGSYSLYTSATALTEGAYFYEQLTNNNNNYAVKVIKIEP